MAVAVLRCAVAKKKVRRAPAAVPLPALRPALKPIIEPVVERLDRHENLLLEVKGALDVQFQRIAALQAQIDHLLASLRNRS